MFALMWLQTRGWHQLRLSELDGLGQNCCAQPCVGLNVVSKGLR